MISTAEIHFVIKIAYKCDSLSLFPSIYLFINLSIDRLTLQMTLFYPQSRFMRLPIVVRSIDSAQINFLSTKLVHQPLGSHLI